MLSVAAVLGGGALGAVSRHLLVLALRRHEALPWGILAANVLGCFVLGLVAPLTSGDVALLLGTGFCGALTTYSTLAADTLALHAQRGWGRATLNMLANLALGVGALELALSLTGSAL